MKRNLISLIAISLILNFAVAYDYSVNLHLPQNIAHPFSWNFESKDFTFLVNRISTELNNNIVSLNYTFGITNLQQIKDIFSFKLKGYSKYNFGTSKIELKPGETGYVNLQIELPKEEIENEDNLQAEICYNNETICKSFFISFNKINKHYTETNLTSQNINDTNTTLVFYIKNHEGKRELYKINTSAKILTSDEFYLRDNGTEIVKILFKDSGKYNIDIYKNKTLIKSEKIYVNLNEPSKTKMYIRVATGNFIYNPGEAFVPITILALGLVAVVILTLTLIIIKSKGKEFYWYWK